MKEARRVTLMSLMQLELMIGAKRVLWLDRTSQRKDSMTVFNMGMYN